MPAAIATTPRSAAIGRRSRWRACAIILTSSGHWDKDKEEALLHECSSAVEQAATEYLATPPQAARERCSTMPMRATARRSCRAAQRGNHVWRKVRHDRTQPRAGGQSSRSSAPWPTIPRVRGLGEDVGIDGGVFRATEGLFEQLRRASASSTRRSPKRRSPACRSGLRPRAFGRSPKSSSPALPMPASTRSSITPRACAARTRGRLTCPMVLRSPAGGGIKAVEHHSESPEAMFAHIPGLKVVMPSSPARAYGLLLSAIRDPDPVVFLEPTRLYRAAREEVADDGVGLPLERCVVLRPGTRRHARVLGRDDQRNARSGRSARRRRTSRPRSSTSQR